MQAKAFRFGRLSSSQFADRTKELNDFLNGVEVIGCPAITANDEEGTVLFVFYNEKQQPTKEKSNDSKAKKETSTTSY